jgi:hypothetical protein
MPNIYTDTITSKIAKNIRDEFMIYQKNHSLYTYLYRLSTYNPEINVIYMSITYNIRLLNSTHEYGNFYFEIINVSNINDNYLIGKIFYLKITFNILPFMCTYSLSYIEEQNKNISNKSYTIDEYIDNEIIENYISENRISR